MKKLIILFVIIFASELSSQTWELMYKDSFLPIAPYTGKHEDLSSKCLAINKDNIAICRDMYKNLIITYNQTTKEWKSISAKNLVDGIKANHSFTEHDFNYSRIVCYDKSDRLWAYAYGLDMQTDIRYIISISQDSTQIHSQVYNTEHNKFYNIRGVYDLKVDPKGDLWAIINHFCPLNDTTAFYYYSLCKYKDSCFVTVNNLTYSDNGYEVKKNIAFDNLGRVWHSNIDTLYLIENEKVIKKISTYEFPKGCNKISEVVVNSKNVVYLLNYGITLYKLDGEERSSFDYIWEIEKYINYNSNKTNYYMCIDSSDNVWILGPTHNLYKLDSADNWTVYRVPNQDTTKLNPYRINIEADQEGKIWIVDNTYGINIFNPNGVVSVENQQTNEIRGIADVWIRKLYPNPAIQNVTLEFFLENAVRNECKICMYNTIGEKVKDITENLDYDSYYMQATVNFSVSDLPRGAYILTISAGNSNMSRLMLVGF
ncbi:MAG: T9SS type A sorting domain-containing protein [Prolixibacteraceae bacterium]|nr:T9SS type A sorting domain-containing protein [Prolixibacteraceae bacterium]